jgi:hypothetical protein
MIQLDHPSFAVRKTLRLLRKPPLLAKDPLARQLRDSLQTESCRDALLTLIDRAFSDDPSAARLRDLVLRCDVYGQKARAAAAEMHLSVRQFFRWRAEAIEVLAASLEDLDDGPRPLPNQASPAVCAHCGALQA